MARLKALQKEMDGKRQVAEAKRRGAEQMVITLKRELKEAAEEVAAEKEKLSRLRLTTEQQVGGPRMCPG